MAGGFSAKNRFKNDAFGSVAALRDSTRLEAGYTKKQVAEFLHVHPSTITREIQRNGYSRYRVYRTKIAQERAEHHWRCRKLPRRFKEDVRVKVDEPYCIGSRRQDNRHPRVSERV